MKQNTTFVCSLLIDDKMASLIKFIFNDIKYRQMDSKLLSELFSPDPVVSYPVSAGYNSVTDGQSSQTPASPPERIKVTSC